MTELVDYIGQFVQDQTIRDVLVAAIILVFVSLILQVFGWMFGRR